MERGEINRGNMVPGTAEIYVKWEALKQKVFFHEYLLRYLGGMARRNRTAPYGIRQNMSLWARIMILTI